MRNFTVPTYALFLVGAALGMADGHAQTDPKLCLQGAAWAARSYSALQQLDKEFPNTTEQNVVDVRGEIFENFRKQVAVNSDPAAIIFEAERAWKELGVKDYLINANLSPQAYEQRRYELCISKRTN